jgi:hypothetical protein
MYERRAQDNLTPNAERCLGSNWWYLGVLCLDCDMDGDSRLNEGKSEGGEEES